MKILGSELEQWNMAVNSFWILLSEEKKLPDTITLIMVMVWDILGIKYYIMQTGFRLYWHLTQQL